MSLSKQGKIHGQIIRRNDRAGYPRHGQLHGNSTAENYLNFSIKSPHWAMRYWRHYAVTLSVDNVLFKQPIHIDGWSVSRSYVGRTSMSRHRKSSPGIEAVVIVINMVAMNADEVTNALPPLELKDDVQVRRYNKAMKRREAASACRK